MLDLFIQVINEKLSTYFHVVSKIIENVMHTQLTDYFTIIFTSQQYDRENSTELELKI